MSKKSEIINIIKATSDAKYKECDGKLGELDVKSSLLVFSGRSGPGDYFETVLVPVFGGCPGTGEIREAQLLAKINVFGNLLEQGKSDYTFQGFIKTKVLPFTESDQTSGLADE